MQTDGYTVFTGPLKHGAKGNKAAEEAQKKGHEVEYFKKSEHCNKQTLDGKKIAQIMNDEDGEIKPPTMTHQLRVAIAQARNAKGWNQQEFAKIIQVPKHDVNSWEAGKSVPTGQMIANMDKVLGVKLPRPPKHH